MRTLSFFTNLSAGRLDGLIDAGAVGTMLLDSMKLHDKARLAGCIGGEKIYVAFSRVRLDGAQLAREFDEGVVAMRRDGRLKKLLANYGQIDWQ